MGSVPGRPRRGGDGGGAAAFLFAAQFIGAVDRRRTIILTVIKRPIGRWPAFDLGQEGGGCGPAAFRTIINRHGVSARPAAAVEEEEWLAAATRPRRRLAICPSSPTIP